MTVSLRGNLDLRTCKKGRFQTWGCWNISGWGRCTTDKGRAITFQAWFFGSSSSHLLLKLVLFKITCVKKYTKVAHKTYRQLVFKTS